MKKSNVRASMLSNFVGPQRIRIVAKYRMRYGDRFEYLVVVTSKSVHNGCFFNKRAYDLYDSHRQTNFHTEYTGKAWTKRDAEIPEVQRCDGPMRIEYRDEHHTKLDIKEL